MVIKEKIMLDMEGLIQYGPINIVIFGDSVSHGAFNDYIDYEKVYWNLLKQKLNRFREYMPVNMINASIGGTTAKDSLHRMDKQVLIHEPDLVIICFGLNDVNGSLEDYLEPLKEMFQKCRAANRDVIFLTPNMLNTYVAEDTPKQYREYAAITAQMQNSGKMDRYISAAVQLAQSMDVPVCDCYSKWKNLARTEDTTMLLSNRINHPTEEMHELFASELYKMIMEESEASSETESTMFRTEAP